jgi:hypothetical protein
MPGGDPPGAGGGQEGVGAGGAAGQPPVRVAARRGYNRRGPTGVRGGLSQGERREDALPGSRGMSGCPASE